MKEFGVSGLKGCGFEEFEVLYPLGKDHLVITSWFMVHTS